MENNTQTNLDIKEKIIRVTIALIKRSDGLVENITVREIAQKADVAVGLINYHFGSKNNLIEICVQRIISHVMESFSETADLEDKEDAEGNNKSDMASFTASVFTFLKNNPEISKISMLSDLSSPNIKSNSSVSYRAIFKAIPDTKTEDMRKVKAFMLLSAIQSAFFNRQIGSELLGFNLNCESDYKRFFRLVTEVLNI